MMKLNWGNKLVIALVIFAGIMATMVTIAMKQNIDLVDKEYYKKELAYQEQIDKMTNTVQHKAIQVSLDENQPLIVLNFKESVNDGEIHLFRPSNAKEDLRITLATDEKGLQTIPYSKLSSGFWRIKLDWAVGENEYYFEKELNLP